MGYFQGIEMFDSLTYTQGNPRTPYRKVKLFLMQYPKVTLLF